MRLQQKFISNKMTNSIKSIFFCFALVNFSFAQTKTEAINIAKTEKINSKILNENRTINIYLPEEYDATKAEKYPVIYILDGGIDEDFFHLTGIVRFNSQSWVNRLPQSIVVGIENINRRKDFTFAVTNTDFIEKEGFKKEQFPQYGNSEQYIAFLEKELQPYISKNYNSNGKNTIIGESLAGLLTTEILLKKPQLFDNYIIISPSLWWGEERLLKDANSLIKKNLNKNVNVYIGAPSKDEDVKMYNEVESLYKILEKQKNIKISFDYMPEETHATVIHQAVYNAFRIFSKKK